MLWQYRLVRLVPWNRFVCRQMIELRSFSSLPVRFAGHNTTLHRSFSKVKDSAVTEMYFEEIFEQGYEAQDPLFDLRHFLYPDSGDTYIQVLSNASNVSEVLSCIAEIQEPLPSHLTQALATLHHFQKVYQFRSYDFRKEAEDSFVSFNSQLVEEDGFKLILKLIEKVLPMMTFLENSFSLMVLR
ncbi:uncharacterized protein LOC111696547 [Eurytemora carolleeae]|uniref:uncharacterized protein LOC111696547 n=1 Tax=Eurytemora carolleeae TaxID=1294199 RepID=UPI000C78E71A|nr:uncharacterized protein LOC111696547 [Eurytemora carolleeae]|eukprot:XP_023321944.1 uncharacterized protein LOC111696547 [Eurytemora affinis]